MYADTNGLFSARVWPRYRAPLEKHWRPYVERGGDMRAALDRCVGDLAV